MCAIGRYENVNHSTMNSSTAQNLMRSANAPTIRHGRDRRERHLEREVARYSGMYDALAEGRRGRELPAASSMPFRNSRSKPPKNALPFGERDAVAVDRPQHRRAAQNVTNTCIEQRQHVLRAHHAAVEQRQARDGHQDDQQRADQHPGRVALVGHRRVPARSRERAERRARAQARHGERERRMGDPARRSSSSLGVLLSRASLS